MEALNKKKKKSYHEKSVLSTTMGHEIQVNEK